MRTICDEVIVTTDDGTYGKKGFVTEALSAILNTDRKPDFVLAVGPLPMMKAIAEMTRPYKIHTEVSLNSIMIDGTGMCGGCRANIGGKTQFVCVDGPEFDAHLVDFDQIAQRQKQFVAQERISLDRFVHENHTCKLDSYINQQEKS
jgi:ferredoxin--NADP+ reductase